MMVDINLDQFKVHAKTRRISCKLMRTIRNKYQTFKRHQCKKKEYNNYKLTKLQIVFIYLFVFSLPLYTSTNHLQKQSHSMSPAHDILQNQKHIHDTS